MDSRRVLRTEPCSIQHLEVGERKRKEVWGLRKSGQESDWRTKGDKILGVQLKKAFQEERSDKLYHL